MMRRIQTGCSQPRATLARLLHTESASTDNGVPENIPSPITPKDRTRAFITVLDKREGQTYTKEDYSLAVKDNISTLGAPTTCASKILGRNYWSPFEASVVARVRLDVSGKTNMDEFGMGTHSVYSPYGPVTRVDMKGKSTHKGKDRRMTGFSPGGSSGGSAVAVKEDFCKIALGTDTGGSVRLPAAYMGVVGFKPSYGIVSRWGVVPYANSLDTVGFLGQNVRKIRRRFNDTAYHDPRDPTSIPERDRESYKPQTPLTDVEGVKIGFPLEYNIKELDPSIRDAWIDALKTLRAHGAEVVPVSLPNTKHALSAYYVLAPAEASSNLSKYDGVRYGDRPSQVGDRSAPGGLYAFTRDRGFGDEVKRRIILGSYTLSSTAIDNYFIKAQKVRRLVQRDFDRVFKTPNPLRSPEQFDISDLHESIPLQDKLGPTQVDFIVCPTTPTPPPRLRDVRKQTPVHSYTNDIFTVPASLAGIPAISIPWLLENSDVPAGIQILGQFGTDHSVLDLAGVLRKLPEHRALIRKFESGNPGAVPKSKLKTAEETSKGHRSFKPEQSEPQTEKVLDEISR